MWWAHSRRVLFSPRWRPFSLKTLKINGGSENSRVRPASNFIYLFIFTWFWFSRTHSHPSPEIVTILTNVTRFRFEKASLLETCSHRKTDAKEKKKSLLDIWGATVRIQTEDQTAGLDKKRWWQNNGKSDSLQISSSWLGERCCRSPEAARTAAGAGRGGCTPCPLCRWSRWLSAKTSGPMWVHVRKWIEINPNTCTDISTTLSSCVKAEAKHMQQTYLHWGNIFRSSNFYSIVGGLYEWAHCCAFFPFNSDPNWEEMIDVEFQYDAAPLCTKHPL